MYLWYSSPRGIPEEEASELLDGLYQSAIIVPGMENWILIELTKPIPITQVPEGFVTPHDLVLFMNATRGDFGYE